MAKKQQRPINKRARGNSARSHLLDVKIRTSTARRQRREKATRWTVNILLAAVLISGAIYGTRTVLDKFFFKNSEYTLHKIDCDLDGLLTKQEMLAETGLVEGVNIFSVDLNKIEGVLRAMPQVATVRVERTLPDQIAIILTAKRPVAWVSENVADTDPRASDTSYLVDATGFLMRPRHIRPEYLALPVIYGVNSENIRDGEPLHSEDLRLALQLIETVAKNPESLLQIQSLDISKGYCIEVINDGKARIVFGMENFTEQLSRLQKLLAHCAETGRTLDTVNLMVRRNTPVTFIVASLETPIENVPQQPAVKAKTKLRKN